tara:strand:- start:186 stop:725 length:540 start_codon:yes stop_codon:yes gene_type:complete
MKNKKSPLKFAGAIGPAMAAMGTQQMLGRLGGIFGSGGSNMTRHTGVGGLGEQYTGIGSNPMAQVDPTAQFNPAAMQNMEGIFGNTNARQASVGASGIMTLEKHLSPVNNSTEMSDSEKKLMHQTQSMTDKAIYGQDYEGQHGTVITTSKSLNAYKSPNPSYDPNSGDDGAGGKTYETN